MVIKFIVSFHYNFWPTNTSLTTSPHKEKARYEIFKTIVKYCNVDIKYFLKNLKTHLPDFVMIISVPSSWNLSHNSLVSKRHCTPSNSLQHSLLWLLPQIDASSAIDDSARLELNVVSTL